MTDNSRIQLSDLVFHKGDLSIQVEMQAPLTSENLKRVKPHTSVIHFCAEFAESDYLRIADAFKSAPQAILRHWGGRSPGNLGFLKHFPNVRRLQLDSGYESLEPLRLMSSNLEDLSLRVPPVQRFSVKSLAHLTHLRKLSLLGFWEGGIKTVPDLVNTFDAIAELPSLEVLFMHSVRLPHVDVLGNMPGLRSISIIQSPIKDISGIGLAEGLVHLHLGYLLNDSVGFLNRIRRLQYLALDHLSKIDTVPSLEDLADLRRVVITSMKRLKNLSSIAMAQKLEDLVLDEEKFLEPSDLNCFVGHPKLKHVWTNMDSSRKDQAVQILLGLPRAGARSRFEFVTNNDRE